MRVEGILYRVEGVGKRVLEKNRVLQIGAASWWPVTCQVSLDLGWPTTKEEMN